MTIAEKNIGGCAGLIAALTMPRGSWQSRISNLTTLAFGLYLTHPLMIGQLRAFSRLSHVSPSTTTDLVHFIFAVVAGLLFARLLSRSTWTRWLIAAR